MKKLVLILLSVTCLLLISACGENDNSATSSQNAETKVSSEVANLEKNYVGLSEDNLTWEYNSSTKTISVSGVGPMKDYTDEEPEWYQYKDEAEKIVIGDNVTSIGAYAFCDFGALTNVQFANSVEFIGKSTFDYCWALRTINFPTSLKYIGTRAFYNDLLHSDNGFTFPEGMLYVGDEAFHSSFKESYISIPATLTEIGKNAFNNCFVFEIKVDPSNPDYTADNGILYDKDMKTLITYPAGKQDTIFEVPQSVTTILEEAIQVTNTLEKIVIPAGVTQIDEGAIYWNYALTNIEVDENNKNYMSVDGVLFTKDGKNLICYPVANERSEYTVPTGCEKIGNYAMSQASNLIGIHINEGLTQIGDFGVYNCRNLKQIGLPKSLKKIGEYCLAFCDVLEKISYSGSADTWNAIEIGKHNELLSNGNVTVFYAE